MGKLEREKGLFLVLQDIWIEFHIIYPNNHTSNSSFSKQIDLNNSDLK
jgi:hypothetical protein